MARIERVADCPFYGRVPKDRLENMRFRRFLLKKGYADAEAAHELWIMCRRDILFWVNTFVWTFEPRVHDDDAETRLPFITWDFQDPVILDLYNAIGNEDRIMDKSRDMTATWMMLLVFLHQFLFLKHRTFRLASRTENLVDKAGLTDSLMAKLDFVLKWMPAWLKPVMPIGARTHLHMANVERGNTIEGGSTTSDMFRGGRCKAAGLDEAQIFPDGGYGVFASTRDITASRIINGTAGFPGNVFDEKVADPEWADWRIELDWRLHPLKPLGRYQWVDQKLVLHDKPYWREQLRLAGLDWQMPDDELAEALWPLYPFRCDGKDWSPWLDGEFRRAGSMEEIEREVRRNRNAAGGVFYPVELVEKIKREDVQPPRFRGRVDYDAETFGPLPFQDDPGGPLLIWGELDGGEPPRPVPKHYVMGVDIATASEDPEAGASCSAAVVLDAETGEQVAEWCAHNLEPQEVARQAIALGEWFADAHGGSALLVYEANGGQGILFGRTVMEHGYAPLYMRRKEGRFGRPPTSVPGWFSTPKAKKAAHQSYRAGLHAGSCTIRSAAQAAELSCFKHTVSGGVAHSASVRTRDPSGARHNHGDRTTGGILAWEGAREGVELRQRATHDKTKDKPNCWGARVRARAADAARLAAGSRWVDRKVG